MKRKIIKIVIGIVVIAAILAVEAYFWLSLKPIEENPEINTKMNDIERPQTKPDNKPDAEIPNGDSAAVGPMQGFKAPEIQLNNINKKEVKLSDYKGKPVLITFWWSGNPESKEQLTNLDELDNAEDRPEGLAILTVNFIDDEESISKILSARKYRYEILLDKGLKAAEDYKISKLPTTFLVDGNGIISNIWTSLVDEQEIINSINLAKE